MALCSSRFRAAGLYLVGVIAALAQQSAPIVQPGAPGQPGKFLDEKTVWARAKPPFGPDVEFMQGMIMHHSQAVEMVALLRTRGKSPVLKSFGEKISVSQSDEIGFMKRWLESRGKATTMPMDHSQMSAADMKNMNMLMPGMLTPEQMAALAKARGAQFDHLFLTGMIQHHGGALSMVDDLLSHAGAGQDPVLFDFMTDIVNTQSAEIKIMQGMLDQEKK
jgi:uncharacterized protein (DUF305 family)